MTTDTLTALVEEHRRELHVHCYRMLASFDEAEDAVQEVSVRAWRSRERLAEVDNPRAWLYKIATNVCLDQIKAKKRRLDNLGSFAEIPWLQPYPDELLDLVISPGGEPAQAAIERETIELTLLAVIQLLPPTQRAVLILREMLGWQASDTAELLEISIPAVNSALQRARGTLRAELPQGRRESWTSPEASAAERTVLARFIDAHQSGDNETALELIAADIRVTMPPQPYVFDGRAEIEPLIERAHSGADGEWRLVPTAANRQPAAASYLRAPGDDRFRAFKLDVLRIEGGKIVEITTFGHALFGQFGLPEILEGER